jgi:uncharacterized protein
MMPPPRDRNADGRPQNARPRDASGRPLAYGSPGAVEEIDPDRLAAEPGVLLADAQRLLDEGRPFAAHEVLEAGWKRAPQEERALWRALAQLAVGVTHSQRGNVAGAQALYARAAQEFAAWDARTVPFGIDVEGLAGAARNLSEGQQPQAIRLVRERD